MFSKIAFETEQVQAGWILWISGNCSTALCWMLKLESYLGSVFNHPPCAPFQISSSSGRGGDENEGISRQLQSWCISSQCNGNILQTGGNLSTESNSLFSERWKKVGYFKKLVNFLCNVLQQKKLGNFFLSQTDERNHNKFSLALSI